MGSDLETFLGLRIQVPPGGHYLQPLQIDKFGRRNKLIQDLAGHLPGNNDGARARQLTVMIRRHPVGADEFGPIAEQLIDQLLHCGVKIPQSSRQIQRILEGESIPGRLLVAR